MRTILSASVAALCLLTILTDVRAADAPVTPRVLLGSPTGITPTSADPLPHDHTSEIDNTCSAWTDGCRSCRRDADNTVNCSNTGIACQPSADRCTAKQDSA